MSIVDAVKSAERKKKELKPLSVMQEAFAREYIIDFNGDAAAIRAGYSANTARVQASNLLTRPHIVRRAAELISEKFERVQINADWVVLQLKVIVDKCMVEDDRGRIDSKGAVSALALLGKHLGMFNDRLQPLSLQPGSESEQDIILNAEKKAAELCQ